MSIAEPLDKLTRDVRNAAKTLSDQEARYLVDTYYQMQDQRIGTNNQARSMVNSETGEREPHDTIAFFAQQFETLENQVKSALDAYSATDPLGQWARGQVGIGPVIAAGFLAHIDLKQAPTVGHIWRFAGLDPTVTWRGTKECAEILKGIYEDPLVPRNEDKLDVIAQEFSRPVWWLLNITETPFDHSEDGDLQVPKLPSITNLSKALSKRPWNAKLKVLCWKAGGSFVKFKARPDCYYGHLYEQRKWYELDRDGRDRDGKVVRKSGNAEAAARALQTRNIQDKDLRATLESGHLPVGQLDQRARRYATKLFLAHYHEIGRKQMGLDVPNPYPIAYLGHVHKIEPPA